MFYLSLKAWEEKSLPKSHLGWFYLVFSEGRATKGKNSIFSVHLTFNEKRDSRLRQFSLQSFGIGSSLFVAK